MRQLPGHTPAVTKLRHVEPQRNIPARSASFSNEQSRHEERLRRGILRFAQDDGGAGRPSLGDSGMPRASCFLAVC